MNIRIIISGLSPLFQYLKVLTQTLTKSKKNSTLMNFWILSYRYRSSLLLFTNVKMDWNSRGYKVSDI